MTVEYAARILNKDILEKIDSWEEGYCGDSWRKLLVDENSEKKVTANTKSFNEERRG